MARISREDASELTRDASFGGDALVTCPECDGEGTVEMAIRGGRWDRSIGVYLPAYRVETCERCGGARVIHEAEL